MVVLDSIRAMRSHGLLVDPDDWQLRVNLDLQAIEGFQAINWVDKTGTIAIIAPPQGNEGALGRSVHDHPIAGPVLGAAEASLTFQASPPLDLFQGGRAFTTYFPVVDDDDEILGFVNGVFRVDGLVEHALNHLDLRQHEAVLHDSGEPIWASEDGVLDARQASHASLQVGDRTWTVALAPAAPVVAPWQHFLSLLAGLMAGGSAAAGAARVVRRAREEERAAHEAARIAHGVQEMERLGALGRVVGGIAHDFNNVLGVIFVRAELLRMWHGADPSHAAHVDAIMDAGQRARSLNESLLTFARRGRKVEGHADAAQQLRGLEPMLSHVVSRDTHITVEVDADEAWVGLAPVALDRLVINLVTNADQAVERDGSVSVRLSQQPDAVLLTVRDDGRGMTPEVRERIFEPFFTTRAKGTGLGLATVFGLVTQAGGRLDVQTEPGKGTTVTVHLPAVPSAPPSDGD